MRPVRNLTLFRILASGILNYGTAHNDEGSPCGIYGAGETGRQLVDILRSYRKFNPVVFIDDNPNLHGIYIKGLRVISADELSQTHEAFNIKSVLIALPNLPQQKLHAVLKHLSKISVKVLMAPNLATLISNDNIQSQIRSVTIEDLVGRQTVAPNEDLMAATISGKEVLITGAGGSIGSELCRQIITQNRENHSARSVRIRPLQDPLRADRTSQGAWLQYRNHSDDWLGPERNAH